MENNTTYNVSGLFQDGTRTATFDRSREGLDSAYDFVGDAFAWEIKCGSELVDELDPWAGDRTEAEMVSQMSALDNQILSEDLEF